MKRVIVAIAFMAVALLSYGQTSEVLYVDTPTLVWDASVEDTGGNAYLATDVIEYEVYCWDASHGDVMQQTLADLTLLGTTTETQYTLDLPYRTDWAVAVRVKHTDGGGNVSYSDALAYSVVTEDTLNGPFVYSPVLSYHPKPPTGLRDSGM